LSHNSFYVFAPQIATASQPVISLLPTLPTRKAVQGQKKKIYFLVYSATPSGQTMAEPTGSMELRRLLIKN
jgi:hypothetical protein